MPLPDFFNGKALTKQKPTEMNRDDGAKKLLRDAERQLDAELSQLPPRPTQVEPETAPTGSEPLTGVPYQSSRHSHTFPCVSYKVFSKDLSLCLERSTLDDQATCNV
mgnify:CR=1 FL=1